MSDRIRVSAHVDRIALVVADVDHVAKDLRETLGIVSTRSKDAGVGRVARTCNGYELLEMPPDGPRSEWADPLAAIVISVDHLDEVCARLLRAGATVLGEAIVDGAREVWFGRTFLDMPLTIRQRGDT